MTFTILQEHDELTLEKADILHAKTITSDGKNLDKVLFKINSIPTPTCTQINVTCGHKNLGLCISLAARALNQQ